MGLLDIAQLGLIILVAAVSVGWFFYEANKSDNK